MEEGSCAWVWESKRSQYKRRITSCVLHWDTELTRPLPPAEKQKRNGPKPPAGIADPREHPLGLAAPGTGS
jgi:hypothetical protein